jgi:uncharacterized membrane protein
MIDTMFLVFLLGCVTGLRSLTAPAVVCWAAHFGWLHFAGSKLAFIGHPVTLVAFTLLALIELVADKLANAPARTAPLGLTARIIFGCLCGVAIAVSVGGSVLVAAIASALGALVGTYAGYNLRKALVLRAHYRDFGVAITEDVIAIAGGLLIVSHF